jgi:hypothetical protein
MLQLECMAPIRSGTLNRPGLPKVLLRFSESFLQTLKDIILVPDFILRCAALLE